MIQEKIDAFCEWFECTEEEIEINEDEIEIGDSTTTFSYETYLVYSFEEAQNIARSYTEEWLEEELRMYNIPSYVLDYFDKNAYINDYSDTSIIACFDEEEIDLGNNFYAYRIN